MLNRVSQTTPQFVQKKRVTVSEFTSDSTSLQGITSQGKGIKPVRICEKEPKSFTAVIKEFENDEVDQTNGDKVDVCDDGHDRGHLSLADHVEMSGMPTTTDAVSECTETREAVNLNDQRVAHLSTDVNAKLELIIIDSSGGNPTVGQVSEARTTIASDAQLISSTCIRRSSLVLSSTTKGTSMNSCVLCCDYASIGPFERTNVDGQFGEDKPSVCGRVIVKLTCMNKGISSFKLLFECY
ncbi:unnamed protein product [Trichobilharzia regenti]|nr:unnamed protein product [Trichobilharzia regenti]